jgi:flagellar secretion chaperone FliS
MYAAAPSQAYQQGAVTTASPAQLVLMCYDGVLAAITRTRQAAGDIGTMNRELQRAQDILTELQVTLDFERGGTIAANLSSLYTYALEQLLEANLTKDLAPLDVVTEIVSDLRGAWAEACTTFAVV